MRRSLRCLGMCRLCLPFLLLSVISSSQAQSRSVSELVGLSLEDLMNIEVVSASKRATSLRDTPTSVTVLSSKDIERYGYRSISEALSRVLGFYTSSDRNYEYLGVRGISRPGDFNTRVLVLVDGHRINDPIYDEGAVGNHLPVDIQDVERIEVIKGPGSAVWGSNALLAVVNIFTKQAKDIGGTRVRGEIGSFNTKKATVQYGEVYESGLELAGSYSALGSDGLQNYYSSEFDYGSPKSGFADGLDDEQFHHGYFTAKYKDWGVLLFGGSRKKVVPTGSYGTSYNSPQFFTVDDSLRAEVTYQANILPESNGAVFFRSGFDSVKYHGEYPYASEDEENISLYRDASESKRFGGEVRLQADLFKNLTASVGLEAYKAYNLKNDAATITPQYEEVLSTDNSFSYLGGYAEATLRLTEQVSVIGGLRGDHYTTFGDNLSPRAGIVYSPVKETTLKFQYGSAFRAPNDFELNYESGTNLGNPNLEPEKIDSYEVVLEQQMSKHASASLSLFYLKLSDLIDQSANSDGLLVFNNQSGIKSQGIELSAVYDLGEQTRGFAGFTYVDASDTRTNNWLENSPHILAKAGVSISLIRDALFLSPELQYIGKRRTLSEREIGGYTLANMVLHFEEVDSPIEATFGIYNLLDTYTYSVAGNEHVQDRISNDGRTFRLMLGYRF